MVLPVGALTTTIPARVAASRSTLSTPTPARPMTASRVPGGDQLGVDLDLAADDQRVVVGDDRAQLVARQPVAFVDLVVGPEEIDALAGDRLSDEDPHAPAPAAAGVTIPNDSSAATWAAADRGTRPDRAPGRDRRESRARSSRRGSPRP